MLTINIISKVKIYSSAIKLLTEFLHRSVK